MSTSAKELIAIPTFAFIANEAGLKQLTTIFNRIGLAGLAVVLRPGAAHLFTPEFTAERPIAFIATYDR